MYRIKLTNGTVLDFDSIETLTVDIHASVVDADALIFHQRANQWLPIHVHPVWKQALATPRKAPAAPAPRAPVKPAARPAPSATAPVSPSSPASVQAKPTAAAAPTAHPKASVAKAPSASPQAKPAPAPNVSVDHLDEELELLSDDELQLPDAARAGSTTTMAPPIKPARAPKPVKKAAPSPTEVIVDAPKVDAPKVAAPLPADDAALLDFVLEPTSVPAPERALEKTPANATAEVSEPVVATVVDVAPLPETVPSNAAPAPAPLPAVAMSLPASPSSAEMLVPAESLLVEPIEETVVLSTPVEEAAPLGGVTTSDLASELHVDVVPDSTAESEAALPRLESPSEVSTSMFEPVADAVPIRAAVRPNRTIWYVGGAVAAASVAIAVLALRGDHAAAQPKPKAEPSSSNPGIPGAPLLPPPEGLSGSSSMAIDVPVSAGARVVEPKTATETAAKSDKSEREAKPATDAKKEKTAKSETATEQPNSTGVSEIVAAPDGLNSLGVSSAITLKFDIAPSVLAGRYVSAQDAAWNDLVARLRVAGFDNLFSPARTAPSGASSSRAAVAAARAHIAQWRTRSSAIDKSYRDSASTLASAGAWDANEQREWESRTKRGETGESAQQANAIMAAADRLFGLLAANSSAYEVGPEGLRFTDSGAQRDYWETRRALTAALGAASTPDPRSPLALVLKAVGATRPPEGINVN